MDDFDLRIEHVDGCAVVRLRGELDVAESPRCRAELISVLGDGADPVVVDLHELTLIDSTGISALLAARRVATERDRSLVLRDPQPQVGRVLQIMQLESLLDVRRTT